jgi:hypothetical protein
MYWIAQTGTTWSLNCDPAFGFGGTIGADFRCWQAGPFNWTDGHRWYVQMIDDLIPVSSECTVTSKGKTCFDSYIRVCSNSVVKGAKGPCNTPIGVGGQGCEVCAASEDYPR